MMSLPERSRVLVPGFRLAGAAGSGICLTQTTTFMADHLGGPGRRPAIPPRARAVSPAQGPWMSALAAEGRFGDPDAGARPHPRGRATPSALPATSLRLRHHGERITDPV